MEADKQQPGANPGHGLFLLFVSLYVCCMHVYMFIYLFINVYVCMGGYKCMYVTAACGGQILMPDVILHFSMCLCV